MYCDNNYIKALIKDIEYLKDFLDWVKTNEPGFSERSKENIKENIKEDIKSLKQKLRKQYKADESNNKRRYEYDDYHTVYYDEYFDSREEAEEWANAEWEAGQIYADYSPTGRWFVSSVRFAHIEGNRWRVRIRESLDC